MAPWPAPGSASAAGRWRLAVGNASIPSGSGSLKITFDSGDSSCQRVTRDTGSVTSTNVNIIGGKGFSITPYGDSQCSGRTTSGGIGYRISTNDDQAAHGGRDRTGIRLRVDHSAAEFTNCS